MNEYEKIRLIQSQLKTEIQRLMLERGVTRQGLGSSPKSPLYQVTRQYIAAVITVHIVYVKAAEELRDWLLTLPRINDDPEA